MPEHYDDSKAECCCSYGEGGHARMASCDPSEGLPGSAVCKPCRGTGWAPVPKSSGDPWVRVAAEAIAAKVRLLGMDRYFTVEHIEELIASHAPLAEDGEEPVCSTCPDPGVCRSVPMDHPLRIHECELKPLAEDGEAAREELPSNGFPWPSCSQRAEAAAALARRRAVREESNRFNAMIDPPPPVRPMTDEEVVCEVLWSLRGDRPAPPAPESAPEAGA